MPHFFYITPEQIKDRTIRITGGDVHHIRNVLRMQTGDSLFCRLYDGTIYTAQISEIGHDTVFLSITGSEKKERTVEKKVGLFLSVPKTHTLKALINQLSEIGTEFIQLVITERSQIKKKDLVNVQRYRRIAKESCKLCGRNDEMKIFDPILISEIGVHPELSDEGIVKAAAWEHERDTGIEDALREKTTISGAVGFIGPEGGITHDEMAILSAAGFIPVRISGHILSVETAVLITMIQLLSPLV